MIDERAYWISWSQINGVGPILLRRLQSHFGTLAQAWEASAADLLAVEGFGLLTTEVIVAERRSLHPEQVLEQHEASNPTFWTLADPDYPRLLLETPDPPPVLYYQGVVEPQELDGTRPIIAIVGTRSPSDYGKRWTRRISELLTNHGFAIASGLAEGIDTEAHRSCLMAGGRTIAVLGCSTDCVYPWSNRNLHQQITELGLILSEHPAGTKPDRTFFPRRNRIIAGLSRATLVMEAGEKSGGLITAHYANEYGRDVYALPGSLDNPKAIGCLKLICNGATPILEDELISMLGLIPGLRNTPPTALETPIPSDLTPELKHILQTVINLAKANEPQSALFDHIVEAAEAPASTVSSALLQLELAGLVTQLPGMRYQRC